MEYFVKLKQKGGDEALVPISNISFISSMPRLGYCVLYLKGGEGCLEIKHEADEIHKLIREAQVEQQK